MILNRENAQFETEDAPDTSFQKLANGNYRVTDENGETKEVSKKEMVEILKQRRIEASQAAAKAKQAEKAAKKSQKKTAKVSLEKDRGLLGNALGALLRKKRNLLTAGKKN